MNNFSELEYFLLGVALVLIFKVIIIHLWRQGNKRLEKKAEYEKMLEGMVYRIDNLHSTLDRFKDLHDHDHVRINEISHYLDTYSARFKANEQLINGATKSIERTNNKVSDLISIIEDHVNILNKIESAVATNAMTMNNDHANNVIKFKAQQDRIKELETKADSLIISANKNYNKVSALEKMQSDNIIIIDSLQHIYDKRTKEIEKQLQQVNEWIQGTKIIS